MLHQPGLRPALFASHKAEGDVENRIGVIWGDVWAPNRYYFCEFFLIHLIFS